MKKTGLFWALLCGPSAVFAQNVFPATGNVGIGISIPNTLLHINSLNQSKPAGVRQPSEAVLKFGREGTTNYSYSEAAEFRIGHGGPSFWGSQLDLYINGGNNQTGIPDQQVMSWLYNGNVGIGITSPAEKLAVNGNIRAKEVKVETANWPDYVFGEGYRLPDLRETAEYIRNNKRLPGMPSAAEVEENGISLGEMNRKLLEKIEELTMHVIGLNAKVEQLAKENRLLKETINKQRTDL